MNCFQNRPGSTRRTLLGVAFGVALLCSVCARAAVSFQDDFTNRQTLTAASDRLDGNNATATFEANEPKHGGKEGGRSLWVSWTAPTNGIVSFWTGSTTNDTLLSAYYLPTGATAVGQLVELARNDDDPADPQSKLSLIQFGVVAGQHYEIAVDGYRGSGGDFRLRWDFIATTSAPPLIVSVPFDQTVREGDTVTLDVTLQSTTPLDLEWRYNGNSFNQGGPTQNSIGQHTTTLVITNFQATNVGTYSLRIRMETPEGDRVEFNTTPSELQLNSEGDTNAFARDKLFDSQAARLVGDDGGGGHDLVGRTVPARVAKAGTTSAGLGVVRGYTGSQVFNTTYATTDPTEPHHCGFTPAASYWFTYQPPTNGTTVIDTIGSRFDNVIAAYTYTGTVVNSYADLIPIACDRGSVGLNASRMEFAVLKGRQYAIVIAGVNGARGIANLNYVLDTTKAPMPPTLTNAPVALLVAAGRDVTLSPALMGSPPLHFAWRKADAGLNAATNSSLVLSNVAPAHSGNYIASVWNHIGAMEVTMPLRVVIPPSLVVAPVAGSRLLSFTPVAGQSYVIEVTDALGTPWLPLGEPFASDGSLVTLTNVADGRHRFYRVRVE